MGSRWHEEIDGPAMRKCEAIGLHAKHDPLGEDHHCDVPFTTEDEAIGDALSYFLGTMYSDVDERWFHQERTSIEEWKRVARALRVHGLKISDLQDPPTGG